MKKKTMPVEENPEEWPLVNVQWFDVEDNEIPAFRCKTVAVRLAPNPLGKGAFRSVHKMAVPKEDGPGLDMFVLKFFREKRTAQEAKIDCFTDVRIQHEAGLYAGMYNERKPPKEVHFLPASVVHLKDSSQKAVRDESLPKRFTEQLYGAAEPLIAGTYKKWTSNTTFVSRDMQLTPLAFSHFTYEVSGGTDMIADIQGVEKSSGYVFTDPQMHGTKQRWGAGDLGREGFKMFFSAHVCNDLCRALGLSPSNVTPDSLLIAQNLMETEGQIPDTRVTQGLKDVDRLSLSMSMGPPGRDDSAVDILREGFQQLLRNYKGHAKQPDGVNVDSPSNDDTPGDEDDESSQEKSSAWVPLAKRGLLDLLTEGTVHRHSIYLWGIDVDFHVSVGWSTSNAGQAVKKTGSGRDLLDMVKHGPAPTFNVEAALPAYSEPSPPKMLGLLGMAEFEGDDGYQNRSSHLLESGAWLAAPQHCLVVPTLPDADKAPLRIFDAFRLKGAVVPGPILHSFFEQYPALEIMCAAAHVTPDGKVFSVVLGIHATVRTGDTPREKAPETAAPPAKAAPRAGGRGAGRRPAPASVRRMRRVSSGARAKADAAGKLAPGGYLLVATVEEGRDKKGFSLDNERLVTLDPLTHPTHAVFMGKRTHVAVCVAADRGASCTLVQVRIPLSAKAGDPGFGVKKEVILSERPLQSTDLAFCPFSSHLFMANFKEAMVRVFASPFVNGLQPRSPLAQRRAKPGALKALPPFPAADSCAGREADELWFCTRDHTYGHVTALRTACAHVPVLLVGNSEGEVRIFNSSSGVVLAMCPSTSAPQSIRQLAIAESSLYTFMENFDLFVWHVPSLSFQSTLASAQPKPVDDPHDEHDDTACNDLPHILRRCYFDDEITAMCPVTAARGGVALKETGEAGLAWSDCPSQPTPLTVMALSFYSGSLSLTDADTWGPPKQPEEEDDE